MWVRVVCGLVETAAICSPTSALRRVDFPAFGRPASAAKPDFPALLISRITLAFSFRDHPHRIPFRSGLGIGKICRPADSNARDAPFVRLNHLEQQPAKFYRLADRR